ncbi:MAG: hypothetical protein Q4D76_05400 [Oscillospiraceae bacterium]|nr:hypothetical protein [Oscillospiraceae bacterium]
MSESCNRSFWSFYTVQTDNKKEIIKELCEYLFSEQYSDFYTQIDNEDETDKDDVEKYFSKSIIGRFINLINNIICPFTLVVEPHYIDQSFRDTFYMYFSNQHFSVDRSSIRVSFLNGDYNINRFYTEELCKLNENFIGSCVINPLVSGAIGRTLLSPHYILPEKNSCYMRVSDYTLNIYGKTLNVKAFPYRSQDQETMRCAEITMLNIFDYYSNTYNDYRIATPSDIISCEEKHNFERVLPSRGTTYPILTKVMSEFGFDPRLYTMAGIDNYIFSSLEKKDKLKRVLHYYIESGIPVAVNLKSTPQSSSSDNHSIVCIGHGKIKNELHIKARKNCFIPFNIQNSNDDIYKNPIVNSADFFEDYVIVDDNVPVYQIRNFSDFSPNMLVDGFAVPLYKRMFLDAVDAETIFYDLLFDENFGFSDFAKEILKKDEKVVFRMFMASSKSLKKFRVEKYEDVDLKYYYSSIPMPRFIWVCELYREEEYFNNNESKMAFSEYIIDATSAPSRGPKSLILMKFPKYLTYRLPDQNDIEMSEWREIETDQKFIGYSGNLLKY